MPLIQRYDDEGDTAFTPTDIHNRWVTFHRQIRLMSGTRIQRIAGRLLGEDTLRYKAARFTFRPVLQLWRRLRRAEAKVVKRAASSKDAPTFPVNYRPLTEDYLHTLAQVTYDPNDVCVVAIDEAHPDVVALVAALNETLNETDAEWLLLVDSEADEDRRRFTITTLLEHAGGEVDVVFADEAGANAYAPILKSPAVGPHTLLSYDVVGRPALVRVETLFRVGGFSPNAGWAFEHDAYLRLNETHATFRHVPLVLPAARAASSFSDERRVAAGEIVVEAALARRGWRGHVKRGELPGLYDWSIEVPSPAPSIDIIIPTRDRVDLVRRCIEAIEEKTTYSNYDIIILDNDSIKDETLEYFAASTYRVLPCPGPFNYAAIVNRGVRHSSADYVVTLNNDTVLVTPDWLEQLVSLASLPDVGIVGACLLDEDDRREHESIVIAPYPQHLRTDTNYPHADHFSRAIKDVAAVTGAVQMVERAFWESLGGMDEQLRVVMNDVDICLRSLSLDQYVLYTPHVRLYHHVGSSRGDLDPIEDRNRFLQRWDIFKSFRDPFFPETLLMLGEKVFYFPH